REAEKPGAVTVRTDRAAPLTSHKAAAAIGILAGVASSGSGINWSEAWRAASQRRLICLLCLSAAMEADGEQNQQGASTNGSTSSGTSSRPSPMNSMSAYERQAVQATLAASRQSCPSSSSSQTTSTTVASVTSGAGSTTSSRPLGASATSTISQSVLLSGPAGGQGQMYLRVNRSLRTPIPSQLIFMPGSTATAAMATVAQQPQTQQQQEVTPASSSSSQTDNDQAQNLAVRGVSSPKGVGVKTEAADRTDSGTTAPTAAHALVLTSNATSQAHGYPVGTATIKPAVNAQTLVVQPLQKTTLSTEKSGHPNGPIPIQPKTLQGLRLPLQLPSRNPPPILPAPSTASSSNHPSQPPHIPVQIVGARQSTLGGTQALALTRGSCSQDGAAVLSSSSSLLTMVASIASREGGVVGRGVGLKTLQTPQEAPPSAQAPQMHHQTNQSSAQSQNGPSAHSPASSQLQTITVPPPSQSRSTHSLPQVTEEQKRAGVTINGDSSGGQTPQVS
ncbi:hypothetical protein GOODEAATRI_007102, partial [Goodea atripinnis]